MTDITNQDRRAARKWADEISGRPTLNTIARAAMRYILATVEAPAPTLSEEWRDILEKQDAGEAVSFSGLLARTDQMEHYFEEARAEVYHLKRDLTEAYKTRDARADDLQQRDDEIDRLIRERHEALAKVERLTDVQKQLDDVQKGAESNAESLDPADVKPGEAWVVECRGERRNAMKDSDDNNEPWNTVNTDGWYLLEDNKDVTLIARLVPAPRVITNTDELERAKRCTIILDSVGVVCERASLGDGWFTTQHGTDQTPYIEFPVTVLWEPEEEA